MEPPFNDGYAQMSFYVICLVDANISYTFITELLLQQENGKRLAKETEVVVEIFPRKNLGERMNETYLMNQTVVITTEM